MKKVLETGTDGSVTVHYWFESPGATPESVPLTTFTSNGSTITMPVITSANKDLADAMIVSITVGPGVDTTGVDIDGAKAAYLGYLEAANRAVHEPSKDWSEKFAEHAVDPVLSELLDEVAGMGSRGVHQVGNSQFSSQIVAATTERVDLRTCADTSTSDTVDNESGRSVRAGGPAARIQEVTVQRIAPSQWMVADVQPQWDEPC